MKKRLWIRMILMFLSALFFCGCVCSHTHVPGREVNHPAEPDSLDAFFCVLDYLLFTPDGQLREEETRDAQIRQEQREREDYERLNQNRLQKN